MGGHRYHHLATSIFVGIQQSAFLTMTLLKATAKEQSLASAAIFPIMLNKLHIKQKNLDILVTAKADG